MNNYTVTMDYGTHKCAGIIPDALMPTLYIRTDPNDSTRFSTINVLADRIISVTDPDGKDITDRVK